MTLPLKKVDKVRAFISYWYMRYLLVTELYIVEPWERAVFHFLLFLFVLALSYLNVCLVHCVNFAEKYILSEKS